MAILVKHNKVSTVPDTSDTSLVRPSDWNADHTLTGFGTAAELDAGVANGVATLDGSGKVPTSQIPLQGDLNYQGAWNASTNTPTLASGTGTKGYYYVVSVAGTTNLDGITDWQVGDWAIFNGTVWQKVDNTDAVTSVNGQVGTVVLTTTNIAEGTNQYFTQARARQSLSAGTGISYDNTTGVITNSSPSLGGDVVGPSSATDNAIARFDTTTGKLIQNSVVTVSDTGAIAGALSITDPNFIDFNTGYTTPVTQGQIGWDGTYNSLALGMIGGNVIQHIGEDTYIYVKASAAITKGQVVMFTGAVGASGVATAAPSTGVTNGQTIIGVAAETIALNGFGLIQTYGELRNVDTSAFADGDILYYNSAVTGGFTTTYPSSGPIVTVAAVLNGGSAGGGVITIRVSVTQRLTASTGVSVSQASTGATITNTGVTSAVAGTGISVSGATGAVTITNSAPDQTVSISAGTGISTSGTYPNFTVTNTAPDQTVVMNSGTGISVTGTYPNFTITNTASSSGTVTSVAATVPTGLSISGSPITTSGTLAISYAAGYSIPTTTSQGNWDTAYSQRFQWDGGSTNLVAATGRTSLGATTVGSNFFTLTNPSAVTFPRMNADNTVSALDAATFRSAIGAGTGNGTVTSVSGTAPISSTGGTTPAISISQATTSTNGYLSSTDWNTFNGKQAALVSGTNIKTVNSSSLLGSGNLAVGTVTSVAATAGTGISISGSPITSSGTLTITNTGVTSVNGSTGAVTVSGGQFFGTAATKAIAYNANSISENITVTAGNNGLSAGPITVNTGYTVTVETGAVWVIV